MWLNLPISLANLNQTSDPGHRYRLLIKPLLSTDFANNMLFCSCVNMRSPSTYPPFNSGFIWYRLMALLDEDNFLPLTPTDASAIIIASSRTKLSVFISAVKFVMIETLIRGFLIWKWYESIFINRRLVCV